MSALGATAGLGTPKLIEVTVPDDAAGPFALDPQAAQLLDRLEASGTPALATCSPTEVRQRLVLMRRIAGRAPTMAAIENSTVAGPSGDVPLRSYVPEAARADVSIVFLHGGGWTSGALDDFDVPCRRLAGASACRVIAVDYRLSPEHPFPAGLEDVDSAIMSIARTRSAEHRLVLVGESAGGNLAAVCSGRARSRDGAGAITLQVLIYPATDTASVESLGVGERKLPVDQAEMLMFWQQYVPDGVDPLQPDLAPVRADDLTGLPATQIWLVGHDALLAQGAAYAAKLQNAQVPVETWLWPEQIHGFLTMGDLIPSSEPGWTQVGHRIDEWLGAFMSSPAQVAGSEC